MAERMGLLGKKLGMTQVFAEDGECIPVTVLQTGPCVVAGKRTPETDGYSALLLGFEEKPSRLVSKPSLGAFKKTQTLDVSMPGMGFESKESFLKGTVLKVQIEFPGAPGRFQAQAKVMRCIKVMRKDSMFDIGARFLTMPGTEKLKLKKYLAKLYTQLAQGEDGIAAHGSIT